MHKAGTKVQPIAVVALLAVLLLLGGRLWAATSPLRDPAAAPCQPFSAEETPPAGQQAAGGPVTTLVLVHGYHSDATVWDGLIDQLQLPGPVRILRLCYRTVDRSSLAEGAAALRRLVTEVFPPDPERPLYFIGHSFGGLVIKQMLHDDAAAATPQFQHWPGGTVVITIDTPHHGTAASVFRFLTGEPILSLMAEESHMRLFQKYLENPTLARLHDARFLAGMPVHTISGQYSASPFNAYLGAAIIGDTDGVVPSRSAHLDVMHRDWKPPRLNFIGGHPVACVAGSQPGWWRYIFSAPIYRQDVFHTRINVANEAVARIIAEIIRHGGAGSGLQCSPFTPGDEGFGRWLVSALAVLVPLLTLLLVLRYAGLPTHLRAEAARRSRVLGLLRRLTASLPNLQNQLSLPPGHQLHTRYAFVWALVAGLAAFIPSWGLTMAFQVSGVDLPPVILVAVIALCEEALILYMFHRFIRYELEAYGDYPLLEHLCRSYGWLFGAVLGVAEQVMFAIAVGGTIAWVRALFGIPARMVLGWTMGWLYGRLVAVSDRPLWKEAPLAALPLAAFHTAYAALFVHVLSSLEAFLILVAAVAGPAIVFWLAASPNLLVQAESAAARAGAEGAHGDGG